MNSLAVDRGGTSCTVVEEGSVRSVDLISGAVTTLVATADWEAVQGWNAVEHIHRTVLEGVAALPDGRTVIADGDGLCQLGVLSLQHEVSHLCGGGVGFADGAGAAAMFSSPTDVAVLPDGRLLVADLENHLVRAVVLGDHAVATRVSVFAGSGECGHVDGTLASSSFHNPNRIAVDVGGRVVVLQDSLQGEGHDAMPFERGSIRLIKPATDNVTTIRFPAAFDEEVEVQGVAIDNYGNMYVSSFDDGIFIITNTGLSAGYHAWSHLQWSPTKRCQQHLCTAEAKRAVMAVMLTAVRTSALQHAAAEAAESARRITRRHAGALNAAVLPVELWLHVLSWCRVWELGSQP
jgi:DNA-binding beta-propeller fold protein YncE